MKKITLLTVIVFGIGIFQMNAQTKADTLGIKEASLNYIEGYYQADAARMEKAIHPELAKRVIRETPEGEIFLSGMGSSLLVYITKVNKNENLLNPDEKFKAEVIIYDIQNNSATVKIKNNKYNFFDYAHLGKFNGEWKLVNVLWDFN